MNQSTFLEKFARWFQPAELTHLAREVGWLVRPGKIDAFEFFVGLVFGQMSALKLTLTAQAGCYSEPVSRQAVDQRYHQGSVEFFHRGFDQCLQRSLEQTPQPSLTEHLAAHFDAVHVVVPSAQRSLSAPSQATPTPASAEPSGVSGLQSLSTP